MTGRALPLRGPLRLGALASLARLAVLASVAVVPRLAAAEDAPSATSAAVDNRARAQQLFDSALVDAEAGNFASACPKFLASQEADPKTSTLLNLAACYEKNGQTASAWGAFREAEIAARKLGRVDFEKSARGGAEALEPRLLRLTVEVPESSRVAGLEVFRDGSRLSRGEWGVAIPVDPGEHELVARAEGRVVWSSRTTVREHGATAVVPLLAELPTPLSSSSSSSPPAPRSWWTPLRMSGVGAIGLGGAGLVVGSVLGFVANGNYGAARGQCAEGARGCPASAVRDANGAYELAAGATVVFLASAALAAAGGVVVLLAPDPDVLPRDGEAGRGARAWLRVSPAGLDGTW